MRKLLALSKGKGVDSSYKAVLKKSQSLGYATPSNRVMKLQNEMIRQLKTKNIWDKLDGLWCFAHDGDQEYGYINMKDPEMVCTLHQSGFIHTPNQGLKGNASAALISGYSPSTGKNWDPENNSMHIYVTELPTIQYTMLGASTTSTTGTPEHAIWFSQNDMQLKAVTHSRNTTRAVQTPWINPGLISVDVDRTFGALETRFIQNNIIQREEPVTNYLATPCAGEFVFFSGAYLSVPIYQCDAEMSFVALGGSVREEQEDFSNILSEYQSALKEKSFYVSEDGNGGYKTSINPDGIDKFTLIYDANWKLPVTKAWTSILGQELAGYEHSIASATNKISAFVKTTTPVTNKEISTTATFTTPQRMIVAERYNAIDNEWEIFINGQLVSTSAPQADMLPLDGALGNLTLLDWNNSQTFVGEPYWLAYYDKNLTNEQIAKISQFKHLPAGSLAKYGDGKLPEMWIDESGNQNHAILKDGKIAPLVRTGSKSNIVSMGSVAYNGGTIPPEYTYTKTAEDGFNLSIQVVGSNSNRPYVKVNIDPFNISDTLHVEFDANILSGAPYIRNQYVGGANDANYTVVQGKNIMPAFKSQGNGFSDTNLYFRGSDLWDVEITNLQVYFV